MYLVVWVSVGLRHEQCTELLSMVKTEVLLGMPGRRPVGAQEHQHWKPVCSRVLLCIPMDSRGHWKLSRGSTFYLLDVFSSD